MNLDDQRNQFHRLLLSPLFLLHDIFGALIPGGLFLLLLGFKGNATVRNIWFGLPFGYKTDVGIGLVLSYLVGKAFQIPWHLAGSRQAKQAEVPENLKHIPEVLRKMLFAAVIDGVFSATPEIADKMEARRAEGALYLGVSFSLVVGSAFPGDGWFRIIEFAIGLGFFAAVVAIFRAHSRSIEGNVGIGIANIMARMSKEQLQMAAAIIKGLGIQGTPTPQPESGDRKGVETANNAAASTSGALP